MNLNWVDIIVSVFLILSVGRGFLRGLIRSLFDIISLFLAVILAFYWYSAFAEFAAGYVRMPDNILYIVSFALVWTAVYFVSLMLGNFIHKLFGGGLFGPANSFGGALLGAAKGLLALWIALYFLALVPLPADVKKSIYDAPTVSGLMPVVREMGDSLFGIVPGSFGQLKHLMKENDQVPENKVVPQDGKGGLSI